MERTIWSRSGSFHILFRVTPHVNLAGDGGGDEGGAVFLQPVHRRLHLPHQRVQIRRDGGLFGERWEWKPKIAD